MDHNNQITEKPTEGGYGPDSAVPESTREAGSIDSAQGVDDFLARLPDGAELRAAVEVDLQSENPPDGCVGLTTGNTVLAFKHGATTHRYLAAGVPVRARDTKHFRDSAMEIGLVARGEKPELRIDICLPYGNELHTSNPNKFSRTSFLRFEVEKLEITANGFWGRIIDCTWVGEPIGASLVQFFQ